MELSEERLSELEVGVTQTRLAEIADISTSTLRSYEKEGLIPLHSNDGKKLYGAASLEALERIKALKADGAKLEDIKAKLVPSQKTEAQLLAELEAARAKLEEARSKLANVASEIGERIVVRRNELRLTKEEMQAVEALRQANLRRAHQVERKSNSLKGGLQYRAAKPHIVRVDLPQTPKRKRK
jgi:DNA-binding transcriptional MerR regulator